MKMHKKMDAAKMTLPRRDASNTSNGMAGLIEKNKAISEEGLCASLEYFIKDIMTVAVECDVNIAIHSDAFLHKLTFCSGSFGCAKFNLIIQKW